MSRFRPERADSIGVILQYACTYRCDHCLYACGPGLNERIRTEDIDRVLDSVARACPQAALHVGGGEPFLNRPRLLHVLQGIRSRGLLLEYVETNGHWVKKQNAKEQLQEVRRAGCACLLLSISPFHNAFLSCRDNERAYKMIVEVFGPQGIFPWHPGHYPFLERVDPDRPVSFNEYARQFEDRELVYQLTGINYLHLAGRAAWNLSSLLRRFPAEAFIDKQCREELSSPLHAHVDPYGHYLTGFCSGLQIGSREGFRLEKLFQEGISLEKYPVLEMLIQGALGDLFRFAEVQGFGPDPEGYVSACHLCGHIRTWLYHNMEQEKGLIELAPGVFYEEMRKLIPG